MKVIAVPYRDLMDALFVELRGTGLARPRPWRFCWCEGDVRVYPHRYALARGWVKRCPLRRVLVAGEEDKNMPSKKDLDKLRGEVGENIVAYELMKRGWDVMKHLGGQGYDLWATREHVSRRIEVKTTDPSRKTGVAKHQLTVILSSAEMSDADFLVYYLHGFNTYFVIPRHAFPTSRSVTVRAKDGGVTRGSKYEPYRDAWDGLN